MNSVLELSVTDGRWLRSIRTRAAIIDAWLELMEEGDLSPTAKGVADRAGIGLRTVFQHFSDMNALQRSAGDEFMSRLIPRLTHVPADLPLDERIELIAASRGAVFEAITSLRRACERQEWLSPDIRQLIDEWESVGTASTMRIFAVEVAAMPATAQRTISLAVDAVVCWSNWNQMRQRRGLSIEESESVIRYTLHSLLACSTAHD